MQFGTGNSLGSRMTLNARPAGDVIETLIAEHHPVFLNFIIQPVAAPFTPSPTDLKNVSIVGANIDAHRND